MEREEEKVQKNKEQCKEEKYRKAKEGKVKQAERKGDPGEEGLTWRSGLAEAPRRYQTLQKTRWQRLCAAPDAQREKRGVERSREREERRGNVFTVTAGASREEAPQRRSSKQNESIVQHVQGEELLLGMKKGVLGQEQGSSYLHVQQQRPQLSTLAAVWCPWKQSMEHSAVPAAWSETLTALEEFTIQHTQRPARVWRCCHGLHENEMVEAWMQT
ncbi:hypothetical protein LR48_Vigan11g058200 [Vigna angularis]|uniref:Uncharacterized protein n=1 Tax=Phaseolus angularis TaxID=3914 RepID=A0A0L9VS32_PHAAN|nr:hypothetical protein LR48_Vigan11g058200 [Vigna angularis]